MKGMEGGRGRERGRRGMGVEGVVMYVSRMRGEARSAHVYVYI